MKQFLSFIFLLLAANLSAQNPFEREILQSKYTIDSLVATEKKLMLQKEEAIHQLLSEGKITKDQSVKMLKEIKEVWQHNVQVHSYKEGLRLSTLIQKKATEIKLDTLLRSSNLNSVMTVDERNLYYQKIQAIDSLPENSLKEEAKTNINISFGVGMRAAINSNFKPATSVELAFIANTRIHSAKRLYLQYGFSVVGESLNIKNNKYFVLDNEVTKLVPYERSLDVSRLRTSYFTLIAGVEKKFPSKIRIGAGGYFGSLINAKQRVKYGEGDKDYDVWLKHDIKATPLTYGLSAHIGYGIVALYAKYSLAPLFKNSPDNTYPFVIGLKFW